MSYFINVAIHAYGIQTGKDMSAFTLERLAHAIYKLPLPIDYVTFVN